jgi:hypothetical protein
METLPVPDQPGLAIATTAGLGKRYDDTWALRDVSLVVPEGAVYGLIGPFVTRVLYTAQRAAPDAGRAARHPVQ